MLDVHVYIENVPKSRDSSNMGLVYNFIQHFPAYVHITMKLVS